MLARLVFHQQCTGSAVHRTYVKHGAQYFIVHTHQLAHIYNSSIHLYPYCTYTINTAYVLLHTWCTVVYHNAAGDVKSNYESVVVNYKTSVVMLTLLSPLCTPSQVCLLS
jgi:hypothetical protein